MPYIAEIRTEPTDDPKYVNVTPVWGNLDVEPVIDRPDNFSVSVPLKLVGRFTTAIRAGVIFEEPTIKTDVNGRTYVSAPMTVLARMLNADLSRLGF